MAGSGASCVRPQPRRQPRCGWFIVPDLANEVVFLTPSGQLEIRLTDDTVDGWCRSARTLNARYFVAVDKTTADDRWGVFDMRTAERGNPIPGAWTIRDPIKTFPREARDGAIMWALTLRN